MPFKSIQARFDSRYKIDPSTDCWLWAGGKTSRGYGNMSFDGGARRAHAHRVSHELHIGPIPEGFVVCHKCDNPACVNPEHLFAGTQRDNIRDMDAKGRRVTVAKRGSENSLSKLTEAQALEIYNSPKSQRVLAKEYGVSQRAIWKIKNHETWVHVTAS